jgi:carbonic anhydrase
LVYAACGSGKLSEIQSPVNIDDSALVDPKLTAIRSDYVPSTKAAWTVTNNGHTLTAVPGDAVMTISGGGGLGSSVL